MSGQSKRKLSFLPLEALPPDLRDLSLSCHPRSLLLFNRRGGAMSAPSWSGPGVSAQVASLQSLIPAPVSTSVEEEFVLEKLVVVVDREK
jgi:hypothetical protein